MQLYNDKSSTLLCGLCLITFLIIANNGCAIYSISEPGNLVMNQQQFVMEWNMIILYHLTERCCSGFVVYESLLTF